MRGHRATLCKLDVEGSTALDFYLFSLEGSLEVDAIWNRNLHLKEGKDREVEKEFSARTWGLKGLSKGF